MEGADSSMVYMRLEVSEVGHDERSAGKGISYYALTQW
jgi:hypothetical protein